MKVPEPLNSTAFWQSVGIASVVFFAADAMFPGGWGILIYLVFVWLPYPHICRWLTWWEHFRVYRRLQKEVAGVDKSFNALPLEERQKGIHDMQVMHGKLAEFKQFVDSIHPENRKK